MQRATQNAGFTLLELMVALTLFVLIGVGAHGMLRSVIQAQEATRIQADALARLQKAMWVIEQDFSQAQPGSINTNGGGLARLSRIGARNPMGLARSDIQLVSYDIDGKQLVRFAGAVRQVLLSDINSAAVREVAPGAVEFLIASETFGDLRRVIEAPQL